MEKTITTEFRKLNEKIHFKRIFFLILALLTLRGLVFEIMGYNYYMIPKSLNIFFESIIAIFLIGTPIFIYHQMRNLLKKLNLPEIFIPFSILKVERKAEQGSKFVLLFKGVLSITIFFTFVFLVSYFFDFLKNIVT